MYFAVNTWKKKSKLWGSGTQLTDEAEICVGWYYVEATLTVKRAWNREGVGGKKNRNILMFYFLNILFIYF